MGRFKSVVDSINVIELKAALESDRKVVLFDCRTLSEYNEDHISGAILMTVGYVAHEIDDHELSKDTEIYVICRSGKRSVDASLVLKQFGYKNVYNVNGGMIAWKSMQLVSEQTGENNQSKNNQGKNSQKKKA